MRSIGPVVITLWLFSSGCAGTIVVDSRPSSPPPVTRAESSPPGRIAADLGIPPGHLPPPGACRIWQPGQPPGHQARPGDCATLSRKVPTGAWLVHRPAEDSRHVRVTTYEAGRVVAVRVYELTSGRFVREERS